MHFTYKEPNPNNLEQGDILIKNDELCQLLSEVHPHYIKEDYTHFLVLTQSCDLVVRNNGQCNSRYITIAAIRPLATVLEREIKRYQNNTIKHTCNICANKDYSRLDDFLKRLFDNNLPEYFYIENEPDYEVSENSCAFLRLSITLKIDHYNKCFRARRLTLDDTFKAKLGWKVGNIYSRIGTPDWTTEKLSPKEFNKKAKEELLSVCTWRDEKRLKEANKQCTTDGVKEMSTEEAIQLVDSIEVESQKEKAISRIVNLLIEKDMIDESQKERTYRFIKNDSSFSSLFK